MCSPCRIYWRKLRGRNGHDWDTIYLFTMFTETTEDQTTEVTTVETCTDTDSCDGHYTCDPLTLEKICNDGFTGTDCMDRDFSGVIDPMCPGEGSACKNGATCFDETCCCLPGFTDERCNTDINECVSDPCQNGGTCLDQINGYICYCADGEYSIQLVVASNSLGDICEHN